MSYKDQYISYISTVKRYSGRTVEIYADVIDRFYENAIGTANPEDGQVKEALTPVQIRNYEVWLMDKAGNSARTVNQHLSALSGFCKFLLKNGHIDSNPVAGVRRPKQPVRLPEFFRDDAIDSYMEATQHVVSEENLALITGRDKVSCEVYSRRLGRLIIRILYDTGIRRAELIGLKRSSVDFSRRMLSVRGKGDKMREIPLADTLCQEILLYLKATVLMFGQEAGPNEPLLLTPTGRPLYPIFVERVTINEIGTEMGIAGKKSPHMLRHTIATRLMNSGAEISSIKEFLGHSSLAATQVYTHNSIAELKNVYNHAHPRAKRGGKNGD